MHFPEITDTWTHVIIWLLHQKQQKSYEPFRLRARPSCCIPVFSHCTDPVRTMRKLTVRFSGRTWWLHYVCWTVRATAVSSCGRCASLCAWWLGQWSWSGRPELRPAVPALSLPPGRDSSAASASANTRSNAYTHSFVWVITNQPSVNADNQGARHK